MKPFKLDTNPKTETGFKIPEGYFGTLNQRIMQNIPKADVRVIPISNRNTSWIFTAAAVLILTLFIPILNSFRNISSESETEAITNYLTYNTDITDDQLVELLETEDIQKIKINYNLEDETIEESLSPELNAEQIILN
jgi:hypothetical protein